MEHHGRWSGRREDAAAHPDALVAVYTLGADGSRAGLFDLLQAALVINSVDPLPYSRGIRPFETHSPGFGRGFFMRRAGPPLV